MHDFPSIFFMLQVFGELYVSPKIILFRGIREALYNNYIFKGELGELRLRTILLAYIIPPRRRGMLHIQTCTFQCKERKGRKGAWENWPWFQLLLCVRPCALPFKCMVSFVCTVLRNATCAVTLRAPECHIQSCLLDIWRAEIEWKWVDEYSWHCGNVKIILKFY